MIEFTKLVVNGFCSIDSLELSLNTKGITLIRAHNGAGKAQPLEEPVLTSNGWKKMRELTLNDKVINPITGKPIKLLGIYDRGLLDTYKITFSDGSHTECAGDHLWSVFKSGKTRDRLRTLDTETLLKDYKVENKTAPGTFKYKYSIPLTVPIEGNYNKLPIHPYVLGFILGDGCISGNRSPVRVSTNIEDWPEIVDRLRSYLPNPNMVHEGTEVKGVKHFRIHGLGKELKDLGLIGCKSKDKFIPELYLKSSIENRRLLLAGLLDTDGSAGSKKKISKVSTYSSKSEHLRNGVSYLVRSLGGISTKNESTRFKYGRYTTSYSCSIHLTFTPFLRQYKTKSYGEFIRRNRMVNSIRNIEYIGKKVCRCIRVDSSEGLYITRDFIVTHNSTILSALVWVLYGKNLKGISDVNTWPKFQPKGYKGTKVEVYFNTGDTIHQVIRCQEYKDDAGDGAKGNNRLIYTVDACKVEEKNKADIQAKLVEALGMSYNLFMNTVMFGQGMKRLIQESSTDQKAIFEEIFDLNYLSKAKAIAQDKMKEAEKEEYSLESRRSSLIREQDKISSKLNTLVDNRKTWKSDLKIKVDKLNQERAKIATRVKELEPNISPEQEESLKEEQIKNRERISKYERIIKDSKSALKGLSMEDLVMQLISLIESKKYSESLSMLQDIKTHYSKIESSNAKLYVFYKDNSDIQSKLSNYSKLMREYKHEKQSLENLNSRIEDMKQETPPFDSMIKELKRELKENQEEINNQITTLENKKKTRELYKWAYTEPLGNNGIKAFLFESSLDILNATLDSYSDIIGMTLQMGVDLSSTRKDFQVIINKEGQDVMFEELSGGEKQLASLAIAFAMNSLMGYSKGVNIAFLDEVFESLSSDNIEIVSHLIQKIYRDKTLFLITHQESLPLSNVRTLQVSKIKGLSTYSF